MVRKISLNIKRPLAKWTKILVVFITAERRFITLYILCSIESYFKKFFNKPNTKNLDNEIR